MIRSTLKRFMYGRYGNDQLNIFLGISYLVTYLISSFTEMIVFYFLSIGLFGWTFFRLLSRKPMLRREENAKFMLLADPVISWFKLKKTIRADKDHCYFKCPSCGQQLRVPRGKGKITITCRGCSASFQETS